MIEKQNNGIQALRSIACFLVLVQHVTYYVCVAKDLNYQVYLPINFGQIGVGLFFVISGFVMGECLEQGNRFLWNRAVRIFPPFWIAIAISLILAQAVGMPWNFDFWSAFLLPTTALNNSYHIPYWTLCYEMAFYAVTYLFILFRISRPHIAAVCVVWMGLIILVDGYRGSGLIPAMPLGVYQPGWGILLSPVSCMFAMGLVASVSDRKLIAAVPTPFLAIFALCIGYLGINLVNKLDTRGASDLLQALAFALVILTASRLDVPNFLKQLGNYSYGTYLIHLTIIAAMFAWMQPLFTGTRFSALWLIFAVSGTLGGLLFGWGEYQLHRRYLKTLLRPSGLKSIANEVNELSTDVALNGS